MTRKDEIIQHAIKKYPRFAERRIGVIEGAEWADKTMIEKALNWLKEQKEMVGVSFQDEFYERFKQAMEE